MAREDDDDLLEAEEADSEPSTSEESDDADDADSEEETEAAKDAEPIEFGKPELLSQEEYDKKIHAPDKYGNSDRKPAKDEEVPPPEEDDLEKETEDADDVGQAETSRKSGPKEIKEEAEDLSSGIPKPTLSDVPQESPSRLDRYQNFINQYRKLQDQRRNTDLVSGLMAAGGQIGQAMAGKYSGQFTPDMSGAQMVKQMGERPLQDLEQQQVVASRGMQLKGVQDAQDPKSAQSQLTRDYLRSRLGIDLPETVSAADAQMLLKTTGRPTQNKYQKINGTWMNPDTGIEERKAAIFNPGGGPGNSYLDADTGRPLKGFLAESLNPFQMVKGEGGEQQRLNKSTGKLGDTKEHNQFEGVETPNDVFAQLKPEDRKELQNKLIPDFNKSTEKTRQRLTHVPVIMQRLQEAQTNPAALPQLKAELARFDVGDQRLAQQEFNMFGQRMGYKGVQDWLSAHSTGTITKDFADSMGHAIGNVSSDLQGELNEEAEARANQFIKMLPKDSGLKPEIIAPLVYGKYKPKGDVSDKVKVKNLETGVIGTIPRGNLKKALDSQKYEEVR